MITVTIPIQAKAQPRGRNAHSAQKSWVYNTKSSKEYKQVIQGMFIRVPEYYPEGIPVKVIITYYLQRPKNLMRKKDPDGPVLHTKKPDTDNLNKAILDAISAAGVWHDDSQIADLHGRKFYTAKGDRPYIKIEIGEIQHEL